MKLNVAAALFRSERGRPTGSTVRLALAVALAGLLLIFSGAAMALDGIDLSQPSEQTDDGECPELVRIKYPFLSCTDGKLDLVVPDHDWEQNRQIPRMSVFTEGDGYWGPSFNER